MKKLFALMVVALLLAACNANNLLPNTRPFGTPIPTLFPATPPPLKVDALQAATQEPCTLRAVTLIGAWVAAGKPEGAFEFTAADGRACQGDFAADVLPLFTRPNVWYAGAPACTTCHGPDLAISYAQMNLGSHADILAGSRRASAQAVGNDILGPDWESALLHVQLQSLRMPPGMPPDTSPDGPLVEAGK